MKIEKIKQKGNWYTAYIVPSTWWDRLWKRKPYTKSYCDEGYTFLVSGKVAFRDESGNKVMGNWITDILNEYIFRQKNPL